MAEMIYKLISFMFYLFEYHFDSVSNSVRDVLKSGVVVVERGVEPWRAVDE